MSLLPALLLTLTSASAFSADAPDPLRGAWHNDDNTVAIHIDTCGSNDKHNHPTLCGKVISASAQAIADARNGGTEHLIGTMLFTDYHRDGVNAWSGSVFVPDLAHRFSSHIVMIDHNHARIAGCLLGRFLCQSEIWQRQ